MTAFEAIQKKVDNYYQKYYRNQLLLGILFSFVVLASTVLVMSYTAYFAYLSTSWRFLFLGIFSLGSVFLIAWKIGLPALKLFKFKQGISPQEIAKMVGTHFKGEIDDQLLNVYLLSSQKETSPLAFAAINQKANKIQKYDFLQALNIKELYTWLKIAIVPFLLMLITLFFNGNILAEGSQRIMQFNQKFYPPNPYEFEILNKNLNAYKNESFELKIAFTSDNVPQDVYLESNDKSYRLKKFKDYYSYEFGSIQEPVDFVIKTGSHYSSQYQIKVIYKPVINSVLINYIPPTYTNLSSKEIKNTNNFTVAYGSDVAWNINTKDVTTFFAVVGTDTMKFDQNGNYQFKLKLLKENKSVRLIASNNQANFNEVMEYNINVIPDEYPKIVVEEFKDSINAFVSYFNGAVRDDYGIKKTEVVFTFKDSIVSETINTSGNNLAGVFNYSIDFGLFKGVSQEVKYFFKTWDNDGINGSKFTITEAHVFAFPTAKQVDSLVTASSNELKNQMENLVNQSKKQKKELDELKKMLKEKANLDWQDKKQIQDFMQQQNQLQKQVEQLQKKRNENNVQEDQLKELSPELLEKQKQLDKLFEELLDEETKKLFEELEKLMEKMADKKEIQKAVEKMDQNNDELEKELDRTLELFKQMQVDQKLQDAIDELDKLKEKQEKLRENKEDISNEKQSEKQKELNEDFNNLQDKLEELQKENDELERQKDIDDTKEDQEKVKEKMESAEEKLKNNQNKGAKKDQKGAEDEMEKLGDKLRSMQSQMGEKQQMEDINTIRQILKNLIYVSTTQEELIFDFKKVDRFDPQFNELTKKQKKLIDDVKIIEDSLVSLSKRQIAIQGIVNKELGNMKYNMNSSMEHLAERQIYQANSSQQFVMTAANNLALLLDESLQQMQNQMMQQKFGKGSCNKPGGAPKPGQSMEQLKKMLSKQIEEMKKQIDQEGSKPGDQGKKGDQGKAKDFAKMAAKQAQMKEKLAQLQKELQNQGGAGNLQSLENEIEKIEKELYNKEISVETIERQQDILTKLLEAENSLREREYDEKRKGTEGKNNKNRNLLINNQYKYTDTKQKDLLELIPPSFNLYYKIKVNEYFNTFDAPN